MGIRFLCPQGHVINVKNFLAGKKGVCPDCGAKVLIPSESTHRKDGTPLNPSAAAPAGAAAVTTHVAAAPPMSAQAPMNVPASMQSIPTPAHVAAPSTAPTLATPIVPAINTPVVTVPSAAPIASAGVPAGAIAAPVAVTAVPVGAGAATAVRAVPVSAVPMAGVAAPMAVPVTAAPMAGAVPVGATAVPVAAVPYGGAVVRPAINPGGPMPPGLVDPIAEAPNATWYIRPAAGGQFGPARADVLRQWMQEGRLAADSHVWREGWPDWKKAGLIFPQLAEAPPAEPEELIKTETSKTTAAKYVARKQSGNATGIAMIVILGLICLGLGIALVILLPKMK